MSRVVNGMKIDSSQQISSRLTEKLMVALYKKTLYDGYWPEKE